jgi:hypothetical protein
LKRLVTFVFAALVACLPGTPERAFAQSDEIQVYDGSLAPKGVINLTLHGNFTPNGITTPGFAGGVTPNHSINAVPEWALGLADWLEAGLYLPLVTCDTHLGVGIDGAKFRLLFAVPRGAAPSFVYGANFEFSYNAKRWNARRITSEVRGIVGWHVRQAVDVILNPIFDTAYDGVRNLDFAPSARLAYHRSTSWSVAVEEYSDFGAIGRRERAGVQSHQLFGVLDHVAPGGLEMEFGAGVGLTSASDRLTLKVILSKDLTGKGR